MKRGENKHTIGQCIAQDAVSLLLILAMAGTGRAAEAGRSRDIVRNKPASFRPVAMSSGSAGVFVGVNQFDKESGLRPLEFAAQDAIEQAFLFVVELRLIPPKNCWLALSGEPSSDSVRTHLRQLEAAQVRIGKAEKKNLLDALRAATCAASESSDVLIVSVSSHGFAQERDAYIMPADGRRWNLKESGLALASVEGAMETSRAGHRLLLVDACQERALAGGARSIVDKPPGMSTAFQDALRQESGQAKLASCTEGEFSYEDAELGGVGHGVFTFALLEALQGGARSDSGGVIRLRAVADYTEQRVEAWIEEQNRRFPDVHKKSQSPALYGAVKVRDLPLAQRIPDLVTLVEQIRRLPTTAQFNDALKQRLLAALRNTEASGQPERVLRQEAELFVGGEITEERFVPFLKGWLQERSEPMVGGADDKPSPRPPLPRLESPANQAMAQRVQRECAVALGRDVNETNGQGIQLALVPPGAFRMGSSRSAVELARLTHSDERYFADEHPPHAVVISRPFYMSIHEITLGQFGRFVEMSEYRTTAEKDPAGGCGWNEAKEKFEQAATFSCATCMATRGSGARTAAERITTSDPREKIPRVRKPANCGSCEVGRGMAASGRRGPVIATSTRRRSPTMNSAFVSSASVRNWSRS